MACFGWIASDDEPPGNWDLRLNGWNLCGGVAGCRHVLICDTRNLEPTERYALAAAGGPAWRLIMLGVERPVERAELLALGCAEVLPAVTNLQELEARAYRVTQTFSMLPRRRNIGPLMLDLFHRDARNGQRWLGLHPREFELLWRLADTPGERVTRKQLLTDVWRINHDPETNSVEVHVSRLRAKLAARNCEPLIETVPEGGYRLAGTGPFVPTCTTTHAAAWDSCFRRLGRVEKPVLQGAGM